MNYRLLMEDCVLVDNKIYFFSKGWNSLFVTDLESRETELLGVMPEEEILGDRLCAGIVHYNGKLILLPMHAKKIWIYDLANGQWTGIERKYTMEGNLYNEIFRAVEYKNTLILIGSNYPAIIRMNMDTYELVYYTEPYSYLLSKKNKSDFFFRSDFSLINNELFLASCLNNHVLKLNLDTSDYQWYEVGDKDFRYSGITYDGKFFWLSPRTGTPIVKWDGKNKEEYFPLPKHFDKTTKNFIGVQYDDGILTFPGILHKKTLLINPHDPYNMEECEEQYFFNRCDDKGRVLSQSVDGLFRLKDPKLNKQYSIYCEVSQEYVMSYLIEEHKKRHNEHMEHDIKYESSSLSLPLYISLFGKDSVDKDIEPNVGARLWEKTRS